ncbi:hypothetical protein AAFF_G00260770 [Aldrovandia affinis]|uniref:Uncharacterized protein n=1 Tax=Aldrovandia affinis TaxID=143900 RepID=A0AAD7RC20_9TELE|nr:hypothetical protein AAFF_G00260770 [Aldrovandia affinis]
MLHTASLSALCRWRRTLWRRAWAQAGKPGTVEHRRARERLLGQDGWEVRLFRLTCSRCVEPPLPSLLSLQRETVQDSHPESEGENNSQPPLSPSPGI